jgi:hypothetical protein
VGGTLVPRAPVAVLAAPSTQHPGAQTLPGARAIHGLVLTAVRLPGMTGTAATRAAQPPRRGHPLIPPLDRDLVGC